MKSWPQARRDNWLSTILSNELEKDYWHDWFNSTYRGRIDTWDHQWRYACWRRNGLAIIPNANLVTNIGAGPDATHTKGPVGSLVIPITELGHLRHPCQMGPDQAADDYTFEHQCPEAGSRRKNYMLYRLRRMLSDVKWAILESLLPTP